MCGATSPDRCLPTQYGGIVGISLFGPRAIGAFLLPIALKYWKAWEMALVETDNLAQRLEIQMCQNAVLDALEIFLSQDESDTFENMDIHWGDLVETFGDQVVPMLGGRSMGYLSCII